jgi:FixJ family two-component response regulator
MDVSRIVAGKVELERGPIDLASKPVEPEVLVEVLSRVLARKAERRATAPREASQ